MNLPEAPLTIVSYELDREFVYLLKLPPVDLDTVEVHAVGKHVTVTGGEDPDPEGFGKADRATTAFRREITLADDVDLEHLRATEAEGVIQLRAPRLPPAHRRKLEVHRSSLANANAAVD
ncbi:MAG TPA: Hsp20 family protein [Gaiellaceae bacterium]